MISEASHLTQNSQRLYVFAGLGALLIGLAAQLLLSSNQVVAAILYLSAMILIVWTFRRQPGPSIELAVSQPVEAGDNSRRGYIAGGLSITLAIMAFGLFGDPASPALPWILHLLSLALLVAAALLLDRARRPVASTDAARSRLDVGLLVVILGIAAFMRLYRFDEVPFGLWYDEAVYGSNALQILNTPGYLPVYAEQPMLPAHFIYLIALSFKLLGVSSLSIRAVSVAFGLATVAVAYFAGKELFGRKWGLLLAFLLAVSRWDVNWSRIGMHGVTVPFFELLMIGLILRALRQQRLIDYTLAGLSLGLGLCFYFSLRLFPVVIGLFLLVLWLARHAFVRSSWRGLIMFGLAAGLAYVPIAQFSLRQPEVFWARVGDTSIFNGKTPEEAWQAVGRTTQEHLLMFNYQGDRNGRHNLPGQPMLDPISGTLLVLGVALTLWRFRQPASFLLLAWFLLMLTPGIFSLDFESPQSLRAIGSLPAVYLLALVPIHALWQAWEKLAGQAGRDYFLAPLVTIMLCLGYLNFSVYFDRQATSSDSWSSFSTPETIAGRIMARLGNTVEYYVSTFYFETPTVRFLAPEVTTYHRLETYDTLPVRSDGQRGLVFLIDAGRKPFFLQARTYYPSASFNEFTTPDGNPVLYEINLSPSDIQASQGLTASYYQSADWTGQPVLVRQEKNIDLDWRDGDPAPFSASVEWTGVLFAHTYGAYRFISRSPSPLELIIDEVPVAFQDSGDQSATISLAQGSHTFRLRAQGKTGHYQLAWQPPDEAETLIPPSAFLLPPITTNGLLARYYANPQWAGSPAFTRIDPWINFYYHNTPLPRPYTVEWVGRIRIPTDGYYLFGLESIDDSALWIDGEQVLDNQTPGQYHDVETNLTAGFHSIRIRFGDRTGYTHINLFWTPPGGSHEIVPQGVLFPPQGEPDLLKFDPAR